MQVSEEDIQQSEKERKFLKSKIVKNLDKIKKYYIQEGSISTLVSIDDLLNEAVNFWEY